MQSQPNLNLQPPPIPPHASNSNRDLHSIRPHLGLYRSPNITLPNLRRLCLDLQTPRIRLGPQNRRPANRPQQPSPPSRQPTRRRTLLPLRLPQTTTSRQRAKLRRRRHPRSRRRRHGRASIYRSNQSPHSKTSGRLQQSDFRTTKADHAHVLSLQHAAFPLRALTLQTSRLRCLLVAGNDHAAQSHERKSRLRRFLRQDYACQRVTTRRARLSQTVRRPAERRLEHAD